MMVKLSNILLTVLLIGFLSSCHNKTNLKNNDDFRQWALTPPMGWNSFDAWDCRIDEPTFRKSVEILEKELLPHGYNYVVIDYIWYHDNPGAWDNPKRRYGHPDLQLDKNGVPIERLNLDEFGRMIPSPERFPSSKNGKGFKPLADWVHSKGLKFGIHIMRGIPRQAYYDDLPIKGTSYTAKDIAEPWDTCNWNNNMWGVNSEHPAAQQWYNSLFALFAEWGVDFVKADNMMFPEYHYDDIEMMRKAIDNTGRPMVFSLSNGEAPFAYAQHLSANANMWRISGDFWDQWDRLQHNFQLLNQWSPHIKKGTWPDADMIPFGKLSIDGRPHGPERFSNFTTDEQYSLFNIWSIARSPMIIGADLLSIPKETLKILTNKEVIYINQHSKNNRQIYQKNGKVIWFANDENSNDHFFALLNTLDDTTRVTFDLELLKLRDKYLVKNLWNNKQVEVSGKYSEILPPHGSSIYRLSKSMSIK